MAVNVLVELVDFLDAFGDVGTKAGGELVLNRMPDGADIPAPITLLTEAGGLAGERNFGIAGLARERPVIQVRVRGNPDNQAAARLRIDKVKNHLVTIMADTLGGTFYHWLNERTPPALMKWDDERRPIFVWTGDVLKELSV